MTHQTVIIAAENVMVSMRQYLSMLQDDLDNLGIKTKVYRYGYIKVRFENIQDLHLAEVSGVLKKWHKSDDNILLQAMEQWYKVINGMKRGYFINENMKAYVYANHTKK